MNMNSHKRVRESSMNTGLAEKEGEIERLIIMDAITAQCIMNEMSECVSDSIH